MQIDRPGQPTLHVAVDGPDDAPAVVLLHGVTQSHRSWDWVVPEIGATHRVVRPDARGHGRSDRAPGHYDLFAYADDTAAVIEEVGGPVVLVGHSLGGVVAAAVAQRRPELVRALLLEDPALLLARPVDGPPTGPMIDAFRALVRLVPRLRDEGTTEQELARRLAGTPTPFGVTAGERYTVDGLSAWAHGQLHLDETALEPLVDPPPDHLGAAFDIDEGLAQPTVVVAADLASPDRVTSRSDERRLTASSRDLTWLREPGAGHFVHDEQDHRPAVAAALRELLVRVGDGHH